MSNWPVVLPTESEVIPTGEIKILELTADGVLYGADTPDQTGLYRSEDWGETWTYTPRQHGSTGRLRSLGDGSLIMDTTEGMLRKSWDQGESWQEVFNPPGYPRSPEWGDISVFGNFVIWPSYHGGQPRVFLSNDYGEAGSWEEILHVEYTKGGRTTHCHAAVFDPYENIIWVAWGDSRPSDAIMFSDDLGRTWQRSADKHYYRCTNIMPLPGAVLFGTDEVGLAGVYRHERPVMGTTQTKVAPDLHWAAQKNTRDAKANIWASRPAVAHGINGMAYFGFHNSGSSMPMLTQVFATDGNEVRPIWCHNRISEPDENLSIIGVYGPDNEGFIAACLRSTIGTEVEHSIVKIKTT